MKKETRITDTEETSGIAKETGKQPSGKIKTDEELLKRDPNSKQIIEKIDIENTPFTAVKADQEWFIMMGKYRLTKGIKSKDEALAAGLDESWWRIMQVIQIMIDEHEYRKGKEKNGTELTGEIQTRKLK